MLLTDTPVTQVGLQLDHPSHNDELNRLLCAAVVSKSFCNMLLVNPEIALASGYQGEKFDLTDEDRSWLFSMRPSSLADLAANMVTHQQKASRQNQVKLPVDSRSHYVRVN